MPAALCRVKGQNVISLLLSSSTVLHAKRDDLGAPVDPPNAGRAGQTKVGEGQFALTTVSAVFLMVSIVLFE